MFNILKSDDNHQCIINNMSLFSIEIVLDKSDALEALLSASTIENGSVCRLVTEEALKQYKLQIPVSSFGNFNMPGASKPTDNYLVSEFLLFLNNLLRITGDKVLLDTKKLKMIYKKICYLRDNVNKDNNMEKLNVLLKMVNKINVNIKNQYSIEEIFSVLSSFGFVKEEDLMVSGMNITRVLENARKNEELFDNLGIKIENQKQKTKA